MFPFFSCSRKINLFLEYLYIASLQNPAQTIKKREGKNLIFFPSRNV